jgi:hypothetical protein
MDAGEKDLNFEKVLSTACFHFDLTEMERIPLFFQSMLRFDHLPAQQAFLGRARLISTRSREIVLLRVFSHRAIGGESRR